jgi:hypothetical protein
MSKAVRPLPTVGMSVHRARRPPKYFAVVGPHGDHPVSKPDDLILESTVSMTPNAAHPELAAPPAVGLLATAT